MKIKMNHFSFMEATVTEIHDAIQAKRLTSAELVDWYLRRIEDLDSEIHAIVAVNEQALMEAEKLDLFFQETGELIGPLHGIPVLVKDQAETAGIPTSFGSIAFKDYIPKN